MSEFGNNVNTFFFFSLFRVYKNSFELYRCSVNRMISKNYVNIDTINIKHNKI